MEAEKLVCRTELLFHATRPFEVKKWVQSKKWQKDVMYTTLLQYAKEHEMTVKDFNCHKSNGGMAQPMTIDAIKSFKCGKKGSRNGSSNGASSSHRGSTDKRSTDKMCSKCSMIHAYREYPAFGKKCHKCGNKNHYSSCCRSNVSQDKGRQRDGTQFVAGAQRDVTDPIEADAPDPDHGHDQAVNQWHVALTASNDMT